MARLIMLLSLAVAGLALFTACAAELVGLKTSPLQLLRDVSTSSENSDEPGLHKAIRVPGPRFRLPTGVVPTHYFLQLRPILVDSPDAGGDQWTVPGHVTISMTCVQSTTNVTLHYALNQIIEESIYVRNAATGASVIVMGHEYNTDMQFYIVRLAEPGLQAGQSYTLSVDFVAPLHTNRLDGIYRTHYINPDSGERRYMVATQFQAFGARSAFPCFDEPGLKTPFDIAIGRLQGWKSIGNTMQNGTQPVEGLPGWIWDLYERTVPMPTYLVALIVSIDADFTFHEAPPGIYPKLVRTAGQAHLIAAGGGDYASTVAAKDLAFFEDYYQAEYSLSKMDSAGIIDFGAGAMENWGLNIYREEYLLYFPEDGTESDRKRINQIIAHELAHQWYGNLITCNWWTGAWLNEGFASYVQFLGVNHTDPEFEPLKTRLYESNHPAMRADVLDNSHPTLLPEKGDPYDTMTYQTALVYQKGSAILRMMEGFLGERTLQVGCQNYLRRFAFGATEQDDLFQVLHEQALADNKLPAGMTIKGIMDTWTLQKGFPLLRVSTVSASRVYISQERFENHDTNWTDPVHDMWYVPLSVVSQNDPVMRTSWIDKSAALSSMVHNTSQWILINAHAYGYFRVLYDEPLTGKLWAQLETDHEQIDLWSRSQLIDDHFTSAFQMKTSVDNALTFTKHLHKETEYTVWYPVLFHLRKAYNLFGDPEFFALKDYLAPKILSVFELIHMEPVPEDKGILVVFRAHLLDWLCGMGTADCVNYSLGLFNAWKETPATNNIPNDYRPVVYCTAVAHGVNGNVDFIWERYLEATTNKRRSTLIPSVGCSRNETTLQAVLGWTLDDASGLRPEHRIVVLQSVAGVPLARPMLLTHLETHLTHYLTVTNSISGVFSTLSNYVYVSDDIELARGFIDRNTAQLGNLANTLRNHVRTMENNADWMRTFGAQIADWLEAENQP